MDVHKKVGQVIVGQYNEQTLLKTATFALICHRLGSLAGDLFINFREVVVHN